MRKGPLTQKESTMNERRVAILGVIVENPASVDALNAILHECKEWIIGRMGIPYKERSISIISIVMDAPAEIISSLSGKIGMLDGVTCKATYSTL